MSDLVDNDKLDSYAAYVDKHGLFDLFHNIITKITIEKPVEPFQFIIDRLQKPFRKSSLHSMNATLLYEILVKLVSFDGL